MSTLTHFSCPSPQRARPSSTGASAAVAHPPQALSMSETPSGLMGKGVGSSWLREEDEEENSET